jgi:hypothetical protein
MPDAAVCSFPAIHDDILADLQRKAIPQQEGTPVQNFLS